MSIIELNLDSASSENTINTMLTCLGAIATILGALATVITAIIAGIALNYAMKEYNLHKKREESDILAKFNERYSTDENIQKSLKDLIVLKKNKNVNNPEVLNHHEMFLRFFEELQIAIENKALNPEIVCYMFAYYAIEADRCDDFVSKEDNYQTWKRFKVFVQDMKKIAQKRLLSRFV